MSIQGDLEQWKNFPQSVFNCDSLALRKNERKTVYKHCKLVLFFYHYSQPLGSYNQVMVKYIALSTWNVPSVAEGKKIFKKYFDVREFEML